VIVWCCGQRVYCTLHTHITGNYYDEHFWISVVILF
jgi:hypothetical protein